MHWESRKLREEMHYDAKIKKSDYDEDYMTILP